MAKNIVAAQLSPDEMETWKCQDVHDLDDKKLGKLKDVYLDEETNHPKWGLVSVSSGLLSSNDYFVPLAQAARMDDGIHLKSSKDKIERSPELSATGQIADADEHKLMEHYGLLRDKGEQSQQVSEGMHQPIDKKTSDQGSQDNASTDTAPDEMPVPETLPPRVAVSIARESAKS
jgi:hypothetical protein